MPRKVRNGKHPISNWGTTVWTGGCYAIFEQTLWEPADQSNGNREVRTFPEYGAAQSTINAIDGHASGGVTWTGPLAARPEDMTGIAAQYAHLSSQARLPHRYELALEGIYWLQLLKWMVLTPDLQYIIHPGGEYPNALIGTLRLIVDF